MLYEVITLILFAALASYDAGDPSFSSTGEPGPVTNVIGSYNFV